MSRYALTDEEVKQDITLNKDVIRLTARVNDFIKETNQQTGSKKRADWSNADKKNLESPRTKLKRKRRILKIQLTRAKFIHLNTLLEKCLVIDEEGVLTLNEDLIDIPKRPSKVEKEEKEETDNADEENNEENEKEDELLYEEDQAADYVQNGQNVIPSNDEIITGDDRNNDLRAEDISILINLQHRILGKNICEWCIEEKKVSKEYSGASALANHLFQSQAAKDTWEKMGKKKDDIHLNIERWVKKVEVEKKIDGKIGCPKRTCKFAKKSFQAVEDHLKKKHWEQERTVNLTQEESMQEVLKYFDDYFHGYEIADEFTGDVLKKWEATRDKHRKSSK
ncbi:hypothetical protein MFLAVUS_001761 [Mucor flavus]|uniref:C2H2-type domain-containing protein n=1 Tax=Mucor flavus TaxID=439312 RepID=A0ABP9YNE6_9FUNG